MRKKSKRTTFGMMIESAMEQNRLSVNDLVKIMRCNRSTLTRHLNGTSKPSYMECIAYGAVLKISHEFLWDCVNDDSDDEYYNGDFDYSDLR